MTLVVTILVIGFVVFLILMAGVMAETSESRENERRDKGGPTNSTRVRKSGKEK
ncbi:MAG: hypothetical protein WEB89_00890 [Balneolales bacterium]